MDLKSQQSYLQMSCISKKMLQRSLAGSLRGKYSLSIDWFSDFQFQEFARELQYCCNDTGAEYNFYKTKLSSKIKNARKCKSQPVFRIISTRKSAKLTWYICASSGFLASVMILTIIINVCLFWFLFLLMLFAFTAVRTVVAIVLKA